VSKFSAIAGARNRKRKGHDRSLKPSRAVELRYLMVAKQVTRIWAECVMRALRKHESRLVTEPRADATPERFDAVKTKTQRSAIKAFTDDVSLQFGETIASVKPIKIALQDIGKRSLMQSQAETRRVGIVVKKEPDMAGKLATWRESNLKLITALGQDQVDRLREVLEEAPDLNVKSLRGLIEKRVDVTRSKADMLARDQTLKLNAAINRDRMAAAGIDSYVWRTSRDERVRESHKDLEGKRFKFEDPPVSNDAGDENNPGEDYQCRCTAEPVIPGVNDDDDPEEE
jgi:SPP1 gp7 family putative phage head morphogenesis protein